MSLQVGIADFLRKEKRQERPSRIAIIHPCLTKAPLDWGRSSSMVCLKIYGRSWSVQDCPLTNSDCVFRSIKTRKERLTCLREQLKIRTRPRLSGNLQRGRFASRRILQH